MLHCTSASQTSLLKYFQGQSASIWTAINKSWTSKQNLSDMLGVFLRGQRYISSLAKSTKYSLDLLYHKLFEIPPANHNTLMVNTSSIEAKLIDWSTNGLYIIHCKLWGWSSSVQIPLRGCYPGDNYHYMVCSCSRNNAHSNSLIIL